MSDNPFAEPDDADRTLIRPAPGGRRGAASPSPAPVVSGAEPATLRPGTWSSSEPPRAAASAAVTEGAETIAFGHSPLIAAAAPLLALLARVRNTYAQPDPGELRERAIAGLRAFEQKMRVSNTPAEQIRPAHYALAASLDDVVLNTPWGSAGAWAQRSLVSTFHQEVQSGERFFELLAQLRQNPGTYLPVLELMYLCLSLGFQGRYRLSPRGPGELERLREDLYTIIVRQRQATDPALSPHWQGVLAPYRPARAVVPTWVMGAAALAVVGGLFAWFSTGLNAASDAVFAGMLNAPPAHLPAITRAGPVQPPTVPAGAPDALATFLKPEIDQGLVSVLGTASMPVVRIHNAGMFASGRAEPSPRFQHLLTRIGEALKTEKGRVVVVGYTDNQPIHTIRFPSNYQLSAARASAAGAVISRALGDPARVSTEGRGQADPITSNATPQGREENRRIEVVLDRQG